MARPNQITHLIDITPTILEAAGIPAPETVDGIEQKPMDGASIASTFELTKSKSVRERQYFEIFSNRAMYDDGRIACAQHAFPWRQDFPRVIGKTTNGNSLTLTAIAATTTIWLQSIPKSAKN